MGLTAEQHPPLYDGFCHSWQTLLEAVTGAVGGDRTDFPPPQRCHYATLLLARLVAVAALQQRGYLGGDEWFLQNQFGQSQQRGTDGFFAQVLQPLCQQGLTLPPEEHAPALQQRFGSLPFVPNGPFRPTALDRRWGHLPLPDAAFEPALHWLADLAVAPAAWGSTLGRLLEQGVNGHTGPALVTPEPLLAALVNRTLRAALGDRATRLTGRSGGFPHDSGPQISPAEAGALLAELGQIAVLDPTCGSGRWLVAALEELIDLATTLRAIAAQDPAVAVPSWASLSPGVPSAAAAVGLYRHFASRALYGLDLWPPAVELARLHLWLAGVQHTAQPADLASLPDLTLTILSGNALVGLVQVEAERFDQVPRKRGKKAGEAALQGNLLQPLMADSYQAILAERQVRLEHYRSQTELLAEVGSVPAYAQADFLRDRLDELNTVAQDKLTHLLWREGSQQLSLRVPTPGGSRPSRPLALADVEALRPFHWGFYFHQRLAAGGFDVVLGHLPPGAIEATQAGFVERYADVLEHNQVAPAAVLHSPPSALATTANLAQAWAEYRGEWTWLSQYLRRCGTYPHSAPDSPGQGRLQWSRLLLERSLQLLRPGGRCAVLLDPFWPQDTSAPLRQWLLQTARVAAAVDLSNHRGLWPTAPARTTLCALWIQTPGPTSGNPYTARTKDTALNPQELETALQDLPPP